MPIRVHQVTFFIDSENSVRTGPDRSPLTMRLPIEGNDRSEADLRQQFYEKLGEGGRAYVHPRLINPAKR